MTRCCKTITLLLLLAYIPIGSIIAQTRQISATDSLMLSIWETAGLNVPMLHTQNQAALWHLPLQQMGHSVVSGSKTGGSYRRPQQPKGTDALHLLTERYQRTDKVLWYGKFAFEQSWNQDIAWNSLLDPYRGTPYILADSIGGNWKKQHYSLQAMAATEPLWNDRLHLGLDLQYALATGAKQIDPRPLNYSTTLSLSPSALWNLTDRQQIGLAAKYRSFKENISLEIRQPNTNHNLYRFKGMSIHDNAIPVTSGSSRYYSSNLWGGELQYQITWDTTYSAVTSFGYDQLRESTRDGATFPAPAGDYAHNRFRGKMIVTKKTKYHRQQIVLKASSWQDEGTEYHTNYDNEEGQYIVNFSGVLYEQRGYQGSLSYHVADDHPSQDIARMLYVGVDMNKRETSYLYIQPSTQDILQLSYYLGVGYNISLQWRFKAQVGYIHTPVESLAYTPKAGPNTAAQEVLFPDHDYLSATRGHVDLHAKRLFRFVQTGKAQWYIHAQTRYERRLDKTTYSNYGSDRYHIHIGFGTYY